MKPRKFDETKFYRTQTGLVLSRLQMQPGMWVGLPDLMAASGSGAVHTRIDVLRKRGWKIEQADRRKRGEHLCKSCYMLVIEDESPAPVNGRATPQIEP